MVLIMNVLKSKKIVKPRGSLKVVDYDTKGSLPEKGYDSDTQDEAKGGMENLKKGSGGSSKKKKKLIDDCDLDRESDFMEELVRDHYKKRSGGKGKSIKGNHDERASSPSDDEPLAHQMERKRFSSRRQEEKLQSLKNGDSDNEDYGEQG